MASTYSPTGEIEFFLDRKVTMKATNRGDSLIAPKLASVSTSKGEASVSDLMSVAEIRSQFESEWVLIEDPELTQHLEVKGGKVLWHSKDRDEVYRKARELHLRPKHAAILYIEVLSRIK